MERQWIWNGHPWVSFFYVLVGGVLVVAGGLLVVAFKGRRIMDCRAVVNLPILSAKKHFAKIERNSTAAVPCLAHLFFHAGYT